MCVVEKKTEIHSDGRKHITENRRLCHRAVGNNLCSHVETRNVEVARVVEIKPTTSRPPPAEEGVVVTQGPSGRRVYRTLSQRTSSRPTSSHAATASSSPSAERKSTSPPVARKSSSPSVERKTYSYAPEPNYVEVKPSTSSGHPASPASSKPRRTSTATTQIRPEVKRKVEAGGTAIYDFPPSLGMSRATNNERASSSRPTSSAEQTPASSVAPNIDRTPKPAEHMPPTFQQHRPGRVNIVSRASSPSNHSSSPPTSSPGLSNLPPLDRFRSDSVNDLTSDIPQPSRSKGKQPVRDDDFGETEADRRRRLQEEEDASQAARENERIASTQRRQQAREARDALFEQQRREETELAAAEARVRAEDERRALDAAVEAELQARRDALAAADQQDRDAARQRHVDAELRQMARERAASQARSRDSFDSVTTYPRPSLPLAGYPYAEQYTSPRRISAPPPGWRPTSSPLSQTSSASLPYSARITTPYTVTVHNPSAHRESSVHDHGEAVIARAQMRNAAEAMGALEIDDLAYEEDFDAVADAGRRSTRAQRDRERDHRERRRREEGYY